MFSISKDDIVAVRRAYMAGGHERAMAEVRRRWLLLNDKTAPDVLDRILAMPVDPVPFAGKREPRRDGPKR